MRWLALALSAAFVVFCLLTGCARERTPRAHAAPRASTPGTAFAPPPPSDSRFAPPPPASGSAEPPPPAPSATPPPANVSSLPPGPPTCPKTECGPAPMYPTEDCADGQHLGGRGPCLRHADGKCGWTRLTCPVPDAPACSCGSPISPSHWLCPDGVHDGEIGPCVKGKDGCGLLYRPCPPGSMRPPPSPRPPPPPKTQSIFKPCDPLPSLAVLRTWPINSICAPGGGPVQPRRKYVRSLGDGTSIIQQRQGCFRVRYRRCFGK